MTEEKELILEGEEIKTGLEDDKETTAIQPYMIRPVVKVEEALAAWKEYQDLKHQLADDGDFVTISKKQHPTKQFANKLSKFFGLSVEIVRADKESVGEKDFVWHIWARATAPNGQFRDGDGHCASNERTFSHLQHDVYATAVTRAKNRAILELAGFGEVSAEEMGDSDWTSGTSTSISKFVSKEQGRKTEGGQGADSPTVPSPAHSEEHKGNCEGIKSLLITKTIDPKDFKKWLFNLQQRDKEHRQFVGLKFGNYSFEEGNPKDVAQLIKNLDKVIPKYLEDKIGLKEKADASNPLS